MKIIYSRPNVYSAEGVTLLPGVNIVPDADAKRFLSNPGVQFRVRAGAIRAETNGGALTAADVAEMSDVARLRDLAAGPPRAAVTKAAKARLAEIDAMAGGQDGSEGGAGVLTA